MIDKGVTHVGLQFDPRAGNDPRKRNRARKGSAPWNRRLRELKQQDALATATVNRLRVPFRDDAPRRRRELFASALDAAQREGITIDAWFNYRFADPELSARADWAGLIDEAAKTAEDVWAA